MRPIVFCILLAISSTSIFAQSEDWELAFNSSPTLGISSIKFTPNGEYLASGSVDGSVKLWEVNSQRIIYDIKAHKDDVTVIDFTDDGELMITGSRDGTVKIWTLKSGNLKKELYCYTDGVEHVEIGPNNNLLLTFPTFEISKPVKLWDMNNGAELRSLGKKSAETIEMLTKSNDIEAMYKVQGTMLWNAKTDQVVCDLASQLEKQDESIEEIDHVSFNSNNTKLAFTDYRKLFIVDLRTFEIQSFYANISEMNSAILSPSGRRLMISTGSRFNKLWNLNDLTFSNINGWGLGTKDAKFSPNDDKLATISALKPPTLWNLENGENIKLKGHKKYVVHVEFSKDGRKVLTCSWDGTARVWDANSGDLISVLNGHLDKIGKGEFSNDGSLVVTIGHDATAKTWDVSTGHMLSSINSTYMFDFAHFSTDDRYLMTSEGNDVVLWNLRSGDRLKTFTGHDQSVSSAIFHPDNKTVITGSLDRTIRRWKISTGEEIGNYEAHRGYIEHLKVSPDKKYIVSTSFDGTAKIWDIEDFSLVHSLEGHNGKLTDINFSRDGEIILTSSVDGRAIIWDTTTGEKLVETFNLDEKYKLRNYDFAAPDEFLWKESKSNYYYSSTSVIKKLYFRKGLQTISFDQLDIKYNRPDKILEALGSRDTALVHAYKKAYIKRIQKLGIDTSAFQFGFSVPESQILNSDLIEYIQRERNLILKLHYEDTTSLLDRINILVNGVPYYGSRGMSLRGRQLSAFDTTLCIPLNVGKNQIEASVTNTNGIKSYRVPLNVQFISSKAQPSKYYFIGLGIDHFKQPGNDLSYSVKDIRDLAKSFKRKYGNRCTIDTLFNRSINIENLKAIKEKLYQTHVDDKVVISYSGHGLLNDNLDYYLSTYTTDFASPENGGLPYENLENLLDSIPARQKLLLIDACHSGEVDKESEGQIETVLASNKSLANGLNKGAKDISYSSPILGNKSAFQLMQELFANVNNDIGATVLSAAAGTQFAYEKGGNGIFSHSILDYMKRRNTFTVQELKSYVMEQVQKLTDGVQQPTSRLETHNNDWVLWED